MLELDYLRNYKPLRHLDLGGYIKGGGNKWTSFKTGPLGSQQ